MRITHLQLKNFRCFESLHLDFHAPVILIAGLNGAGKTSLLEAMHYVGYLRSFRTHLPQELMMFNKESFFIKVSLQGTFDESYELQVGFSKKKRLVKVNDKALSSYKELLHYYRVITVTEEDLGLIKEGPDLRRLFIDQFIVLNDTDFSTLLKRNKAIVEQRNALLRKGGSSESYHLWTHQLWQTSAFIEEKRRAALATISQALIILINEYFNQEFQVNFTYQHKKALLGSYEEFQNKYPHLYNDEQRFGYSLFGAHLDDFLIWFKDLKSKSFASRGQQKLILILLKAAQIKLLKEQGRDTILLLDDFMTDFDQIRTQILLKMLTDLKIQLIFTVPAHQGQLEETLRLYSPSFTKLTI